MSRPLDYARPETRPSHLWIVIGWVSFLCGVGAVAAFAILCIAWPWDLFDIYWSLLGFGLLCGVGATVFGNRTWSATAGLFLNVIMAFVTVAVRFFL